MAYQIAAPDPSQTAGAAPTDTSGQNFWTDLFGGKNHAGVFGGGYNVANPQNFNLPGFNQDQQAYTALANQAVTGGQSQFAPQQQQLAQSLFGTINGQGPSVAQQQLQQTTQGNLANAYAMAASGRYNPAAARQAADNAAAVNQQAAGQGSLLRAQETQNAQGMLGNVLASGRGQDISQFQAQNQAAQGYLGQNLQAQQAQQLGQENYEQNQLGSLGNAQSNAVGGKVLSAASSIGTAAAMAGGGYVPGYATGGDSAANDTVRAMLSPGEVVVPRSIVQSKDAAKKAAAFVAAVKARHARRAA